MSTKRLQISVIEFYGALRAPLPPIYFSQIGHSTYEHFHLILFADDDDASSQDNDGDGDGDGDDDDDDDEDDDDDHDDFDNEDEMMTTARLSQIVLSVTSLIQMLAWKSS